MIEKISAMVVCAIVVAVVAYAIVFLTPESTDFPVTQEEYRIQAVEQEELRMQKAKIWAQGQDFGAEKRARIAKYRQEHNLPKKRNSRTKNDPAERWMDYALQTSVFSSVDHINHEVAVKPSDWRGISVDTKWQLMEQVHLYFDGYATIVSSISGRPLASYNAWNGIKIHD